MARQAFKHTFGRRPVSFAKAVTMSTTLAVTGAVTLASTLALTGAATLSAAATFDGVATFMTATDALVAGAGTSSTPHELGSTAGTALNFRFRSSHTSGDARGMYLRLDLDGAAVGAEALRTFTEIENVAVGVGGTINSIHATMEIDGNSGNISGAGNVIRATLGGSGTKTLTGTLSGVLIDMDLPSAVTLGGGEAAIRIGKAQDHEWPVALAFDSTVGTGNAIEASAVAPTGNTTHGIHIKVDGTSGYIPVYAAIGFGN